MARQFPEIVTCSSAFSFALEAERACADFAAAAGVLAPDDAWQAKLEELVCAHDDRVDKLGARRPGVDMAVTSLNGHEYSQILGGEPVTNWPGAVEQLIEAELEAARYHEAFAQTCADALGDGSRAFEKSGAQARAAATELRDMIH